MSGEERGRFREGGRAATGPRRRAGPEAGFSLIEALVTVGLILFVVLGIANMTGVGIAVDKDAGDATQSAAWAADKLEELRGTAYEDIAVGGSLDEDQDGFSDVLDVDGDGVDDLRRRWEVTDLGGMLRLRVRTVALFGALGPPQGVTLSTQIAERLTP